LVAVACFESIGLVFINQHSEANIKHDVLSLPKLIPDDYRLLNSSSQIVKAFWKLHLENSLEGYHIRRTHKNTFFPVQYDNLTVAESFGDNSRVAFPYQSIEGLIHKKQVDINVNARLIYVYRLFPNVVISTFPG
jgi:hypothetical protein